MPAMHSHRVVQSLKVAFDRLGCITVQACRPTRRGIPRGDQRTHPDHLQSKRTEENGQHKLMCCKASQCAWARRERCDSDSRRLLWRRRLLAASGASPPELRSESCRPTGPESTCFVCGGMAGLDATAAGGFELPGLRDGKPCGPRAEWFAMRRRWNLHVRAAEIKRLSIGTVARAQVREGVVAAEGNELGSGTGKPAALRVGNAHRPIREILVGR